MWPGLTVAESRVTVDFQMQSCWSASKAGNPLLLPYRELLLPMECTSHNWRLLKSLSDHIDGATFL